MTVLLNRRAAFRAAAVVALEMGSALPARPQEPQGVMGDVEMPRNQRGFYPVGELTENGLSQGHAWYEATRRAELSSVRVSRYAGESTPGFDDFQMGSGILVHPEGLGYSVGPREIVFLTAGHWAAHITPATPGRCEFWSQGRWRSVPTRVIACHNDSNVFDLAICAAEVPDAQMHRDLLARAVRLVTPGELRPEQDVVIKSWPDGKSRLQYGKVLRTTSLRAKQNDREVEIPVVQLKEPLVEHGQSGAGVFDIHGRLVSVIYARTHLRDLYPDGRLEYAGSLTSGHATSALNYLIPGFVTR